MSKLYVCSNKGGPLDSAGLFFTNDRWSQHLQLISALVSVRSTSHCDQSLAVLSLITVIA